MNNRYKPNEEALKYYNVTLDDYFKWCDDTHRAPYRYDTKKEFFLRLRDGRLVKSKSLNILKRKHRLKNENE